MFVLRLDMGISTRFLPMWIFMRPVKRFTIWATGEVIERLRHLPSTHYRKKEVGALDSQRQ